MKKKLLFVITQFYKGGAETSLLNLFSLLDATQYEVDFLALNQMEYQDAVSLMGEIPAWIQVFDAVKNNSRNFRIEQFKRKVYRRLFRIETYMSSAEKFVRNQEYDVAISFGEWLSPFFVAKKVKAKKKYVWIHIDLNKADFVNKKELVRYDQDIAGYIFASENSRKNSVKVCPQMVDKSVVIHNFLNKKRIQKKAEEECESLLVGVPYLLSVGNLRVEKNYPRQIEVMKILKQRKVSIKWLCIGSTVDKNVYGEVMCLLEQYHLQEDFILCGADDNPYKYMKSAVAVMVLSDYESWSLVISEAKILGIPIIATNTSGAREQLVNGQTGIITSFQPEEIADKIEGFLENMDLQNRMKEKLAQEKTAETGLYEFECLVNQ